MSKGFPVRSTHPGGSHAILTGRCHSDGMRLRVKPHPRVYSEVSEHIEMPSLISTLSKAEQRELLEDLNYLNMREIKAFCDRNSIPYAIWIETENDVRRKTAEEDRKGVILDRIRHYLKTGKVMGATCFVTTVVCFDNLPKKIKATDRLFYGQYDKKSDVMIRLLKSLTGGKFQNGAIARILARKFWSKGIAPTYQEYAAAWLRAKENHKQPNPEWAFLSDSAHRTSTSNWKQLRKKKAKHVLGILNRLCPK